MDEFCVRKGIVVYDLDDTGGWIRSPPRDLSFLSRACMDGDQDHHNRRTADLSSLCNCLDRTHRFLDDCEGPHARPMEADSRHGGRVCPWSVVTGAGFAGREGIVLPRACSGRMAMRLLIGQRNVVGEKERKNPTTFERSLEDRAVSRQPGAPKTLIGPTAVVGGRDGGGRRCGCGGAWTTSRAKLAEPSARARRDGGLSFSFPSPSVGFRLGLVVDNLTT